MADQKYQHNEECRYSGEIDPLVAALPYYHLIPKDPKEHKAWRLKVRKVANEKVGGKFTAKALHVQAQIKKRCAADPLFFINGFCYIAEPRVGESVEQGLIPFNTWSNQDPVIASISHYWGRRHMVGDKSRAQGASWIMVCLFVWAFLFKPYSFLGIGSKDKETADDPTDPASLGWKIDSVLRFLPIWMRPLAYQGPPEKWSERRASTSTWKNPENNSFIKCYAATSGIGRAGRYTVFFLDESAFFPAGADREAVANLVRTTNGLVMISTPHGMDNEHYDRVQKPGPWLRLVLDWKDNPSQNKGLYTARGGQLVLLDKDYDWPADYEHVLDGRVRSPWYDRQCEEHGNDMLFIAQELDREYSGSKGRPFPQAALDRVGSYVREPLLTGMLRFDHDFPDDVESMDFELGDGHKFDLWCPLDSHGFLPTARYAVGVDLSQGVGGEASSNSCLEIFNMDTREQVGELAINTIPPVEFAQLSVAVCYWLGKGMGTPYLAWESNGLGVPYMKEVLRLGYANVFYAHTDEYKKSGKRSGKPGYHNSSVELMISPLRSAIVNVNYTIRSGALLEECAQYVIGDDGKPMHPRSKTARDGSGKGVSHGDRVIAAAMAVRAIDDRMNPRKLRKGEKPVPQIVPPDSFAGRMASREQSMRRAKANSFRW